MRSIIAKFYPCACEDRIKPSHPNFKISRPKFFKAAGISFTLLQLLFFGLFCYMFGALFQQSDRIYHLDVLFVDYDGGIIGDAVRTAYAGLRSPGFPTLREHLASEYPTEKDVREAVCRTTFWAALVTTSGASNRLRQAISGLNTTHYNDSDALFYHWNEARYPTVLDSAVAANLQTLSNAARVVYTSTNAAAAFSMIPANDTAALSVFANPWTLVSTNIQPTIQGTRTVYNSICIVLILIQDFFYLATINGLYNQFSIYTKLNPLRIIIARNIISSMFTMFGSLFLTSAIWIFKNGWRVSGDQYALNWLIIWLFAHVNFLTIDIFTIWLPPQFVPMALIAWVVLNVTSILSPFALSSPFYRWAYALPAHQVYEALTDIWSNGCNPHLYFALPILFTYEISGLFWTAIGVFKRCHLAVVAEETAAKVIQMRIEAALKLERDHDARLRSTTTSSAQGLDMSESLRSRKTAEEAPTADEDRTEAQRDIEDLGSTIERLETQSRALSNFGPSFTLPLASD